MKAKAQTTHHAKCQLDKKKELSKPPIWGCCGLTGGSFLTYRPIKHPAFLRAGGIQAKWLAKYGPNGLCVIAAISKKAGCLNCPWVKNEPPVSPQQPQIGGVESSFFWPLTNTSQLP